MEGEIEGGRGEEGEIVNVRGDDGEKEGERREGVWLRWQEEPLIALEAQMCSYYDNELSHDDDQVGVTVCTICVCVPCHVIRHHSL